MHSITKKYNFITIVKIFEASLPNLFEILRKYLKKQNFGGCACTPASTAPAPLHPGIANIFWTT